MLDRNESDLIQWTKSQLNLGESDRRRWDGAHPALPSVEQSSIPGEDEVPAVVALTPRPPMIRTYILYSYSCR